jgi:two-component system nitrogen regulation sensor histidine kinase NtrY
MATVLSGVTAGVARLDAAGRIELINEAGADMAGTTPGEAAGRPLEEVAPLFAPLLEEARRRRSGLATERVHGRLGGRERDCLARVARTAPERHGDPEAFVLTFDDMTDLVTAQRLAAWGDVARRIAHEIKNPLTPIQLSAERLKRKFSDRLEGRERERFDGYADMIVRQAGDIRRMVDEFSNFARMPAPELGRHDLGELLRESVLLQAEAGGPVRFEARETGEPRPVLCDRSLLGQALTNLLKNAGEAVEARLAAQPEPRGRVVAELVHEADAAVIRVIDNGVGLPESGRSRLLEPYVTTREKGTGLGLAIVKKITEEHGGAFALEDAPEEFAADGARGAMAVMRLPLGPVRQAQAEANDTDEGDEAPREQEAGDAHG